MLCGVRGYGELVVRFGAIMDVGAAGIYDETAEHCRWIIDTADDEGEDEVGIGRREAKYNVSPTQGADVSYLLYSIPSPSKRGARSVLPIILLLLILVLLVRPSLPPRYEEAQEAGTPAAFGQIPSSSLSTASHSSNTLCSCSPRDIPIGASANLYTLGK
jgi:hypothetical protein